MSQRIFRIQDAEGRGPFRPGVPRLWKDEYGPPFPPAALDEFGTLALELEEGEHRGCGCRTLSQLHRWFTNAELYRMQLLGYRIVAMNADRVVAESRHQVVFTRKRPLREGITYP